MGTIAAVLVLPAIAPNPARADFFDGARRTFQTDIPHFFQDDIPCAFGGRPTSGARTTCKSSQAPEKKGAPAGADDHAGVPPPPRLDQSTDAPARPATRQP
jgi:hypothetical protein